jgi:hypothetical protein
MEAFPTPRPGTKVGDYWRAIVRSAKLVAVETPFGLNIEHALRACIASTLFLKDYRVEYCTPATGKIGLVYLDKMIRIDASYMSFDLWHHDQHSAYPGTCNKDCLPFMCDHVVSYLFDLLLSRLSFQFEKELATELVQQRFVGAASRTLSMMPRAIKLGTVHGSINLVVSWIMLSTSHSLDAHVSVVLHTVKCLEVCDGHSPLHSATKGRSDSTRSLVT